MKVSLFEISYQTKNKLFHNIIFFRCTCILPIWIKNVVLFKFLTEFDKMRNILGMQIKVHLCIY